MRGLLLLVFLGSLALLLSGCGASKTTELGLVNGSLRSCPEAPNCVSSMATDAEHRVEPFQLQVPAEEAWAAAKEAILKLQRTEIVSSTDDYLHAECRSAVFGFVDDLELQLLAEQQIAIRSAARTGYYDFGVNRDRGEAPPVTCGGGDSLGLLLVLREPHCLLIFEGPSGKGKGRLLTGGLFLFAADGNLHIFQRYFFISSANFSGGSSYMNRYRTLPCLSWRKTVVV